MKKKKDDFAQSIIDNLNRNVRRDTCVFDPLLRDAVRFAITTHERDQKQKRKGKDVPYITHPLVVGMILASAGAPVHIVAAGVLHDTIEDSVPGKKVDRAMLTERFGPSVADIVEEVSEPHKDLPWVDRKREALRHIKTMEGPSLWVKSADVISNVSEILDDYAESGDAVFSRFNAPKKDVIANYRAVIRELIKRWERPPFDSIENLMLPDLKTLAYDLEQLKQTGV
jgi:(p)ppGpp synthase/HD superfamily hydrolase